MHTHITAQRKQNEVFQQELKLVQDALTEAQKERQKAEAKVASLDQENKAINNK
eukprot:Awhi_evm1s7923